MSVSRRFTLAALFLALAAGNSFAARAQKPACTTGNVQTSSGAVCGNTSTVRITGAGSFTASAYLGIPYGQPPINSLRWQNPKPFVPQGTVQATAFGNRCPQSVVASSGGSVLPNNQCTDGNVLGPNQSEDCLYLNVWAPLGATAGSGLPVLVFIHGGAFVSGSGGSASQDSFDGTYLAASANVILVTFNYRLGVLGFLAGNNGYNFGFADQILALNWVQQNIANFGGNANNVTIAGESAGAMSAGLHALSSPRSVGLFQAAVMESNPLGLPYKSTSQATAVSQSFCNPSSGPSPCTATTTACNLVEAQTAFAKKSEESLLLSVGLSDALLWAPAVDQTFVTGQPIASAGRLGVPMILGTNRDEGTLFAAAMSQQMGGSISGAAYNILLNQLFGSNATKILSKPFYACKFSATDCTLQTANVINDYMFTCANRKLAQLATAGASPKPLYMYQFTQVSSFNIWPQVPACANKVCHGDELPYVFNTAGQFGYTFQPQEETLSQTTGKYWTSFASNQNPGITWPLFKPSSTYLLLNQNSTTANDPLNNIASCSVLWDSIGYETASTWKRLITPLKAAQKKASY